MLNLLKRIKHWAFFKLVTVLNGWMSDSDQSMKIINDNGNLVLVTAKAKLPILYSTTLGDAKYILTPKGSFVFAANKVVATPRKDLLPYRRVGKEVSRYVYRFGKVTANGVVGSDLFSLNAPTDHVTTHTMSKGSRFVSTAVTPSGVYHFLGMTASLCRKSFEKFVSYKQTDGARIIKIDTRKVPGCWYDFSDHPDSKVRGYSDADAELTLDGVIPVSAVADVGIINPLKGYIEWEKEGNEYPSLSDKVLDLLYPED